LWESHIEPALVDRAKKNRDRASGGEEIIDLTQLNSQQKQDWVTEALNIRIEAAEELLPMPPKQS
jgi:type IV secretion system protein VirD4